MATLKFLREPDQKATETLSHFVDRMKSLLRADMSARAWTLWAHETPHGFSIRLQRTTTPTPYSTRRSQSLVTYSGGGSADFLLENVATMLGINVRNISAPRVALHRRKLEPPVLEPPVRRSGK
jgi:hypothetical protein